MDDPTNEQIIPELHPFARDPLDDDFYDVQDDFDDLQDVTKFLLDNALNY